MRDSLAKSIAHSPDKGFERYPKGSIVLCNACSKPIFKLDVAIALGDKAGATAKSFKPLAVTDLMGLAEREDIDRGVIALVRSMTLEQMIAHVSTLREMRAGDPMMCPTCGDCFVQVVSVEHNEAVDRSYTVEMLIVPPQGAGRQSPVRGKRVGHGKGREWLN